MTVNDRLIAQMQATMRRIARILIRSANALNKPVNTGNEVEFRLDPRLESILQDYDENSTSEDLDGLIARVMLVSMDDGQAST